MTDSESLDLLLTRQGPGFGPSRTIIVEEGGQRATLVYVKGVGVQELTFDKVEDQGVRIFNLDFTDPEDYNIIS